MIVLGTFIRYWLPVCLLCAAIFVQSSFSVPDVGLGLPYMDKGVHGLVYGLLSFLICRAFYSQPRWQGRNSAVILAAVILSTVYGVSDEWHQSFVAGRTSDAADLLADLAGSILGAALFFAIRLRQRRDRKANGA